MHIKQNKVLLLFWKLHMPTIDNIQTVQKGTQPRCYATLRNLKGHQTGSTPQVNTPRHCNRGPRIIKHSVFLFHELSLLQMTCKLDTASNQKIWPDLKLLGGLFKIGLLIMSQFLKDTCFSYGIMERPVLTINKSNNYQEFVLRSNSRGKKQI